MPSTPKPKQTNTSAAAAPETPTEPTATPVTPTPATPAKKNNTKVVIIVVACVMGFFLLLSIAFIIAGAWFVNNKLEENGISVDSGSRSISVSDGNGNTFSASGQQNLPDGFPSEVKLYHNGKIVSSGRANVGGETGWAVTISTPDSLAQVMTSVANTYSQNGWTTEMNNNSESGAIFSATKGDLRVSVIGATKDGQTNVIYTVNTMSAGEMQ